MSRLKEFVTGSLDTLIAEDKDIQRHFSNEQGQHLDPKGSVYQTRKSLLEESLNKAYDSKLKAYDKRTFMQRYVATPLRYLAGAGYAAGTALFLTIPGPAGFGLTGAGVLAGSLADMIDTYAYVKHGQMQGRSAFAIAGEDLITKPLAYLPIGTGLLDIYRGRRKFDAKILKHLQPEIRDALSYAKGLFLDRVYTATQERKVIPLRALRDEQYTPIAVRQAA
ncbi:MAG TPA: hypothetical protein VJH37_05300 [Candidatus Nanoarchaeia archaeon]|nr:hypothetical protein [Candidatus Nanoarchaeia archaeon]